MKRFAIWAVLISATAPLASAKVLVATAFDLAGPNTSPLMGIVDPGDGLVVFDVAGTKVFEAATEGRRLRWDVAEVASGVYLFRVESAVMADAVTGKVAVLR